MTAIAGLTVIAATAPTVFAQQSLPAPGAPSAVPSPPAPPPLPPPPAPTFASGLQLIAYPYLWLPGLNMAIRTPLQREPQINVGAGAFQILGDLNNAPFMGAAELRDGPFAVLADALHVPLGVPVTTRDALFSGGNSSVVASVVTADLLYRVLDQPTQTIDGGLGFRWWGISADTILNGRLLPTTSFSTMGSWADPLIAARYHRDFGNGFGLTAYGDVGGFGIAAHVDWQIIGTLDYVLKSWLDLHLGYRSLNVSYSASERPVGFNLHMKGPIIAASLRF